MVPERELISEFQAAEQFVRECRSEISACEKKGKKGDLWTLLDAKEALSRNDIECPAELSQKIARLELLEGDLKKSKKKLAEAEDQLKVVGAQEFGLTRSNTELCELLGENNLTDFMSDPLRKKHGILPGISFEFVIL